MGGDINDLPSNRDSKCNFLCMVMFLPANIARMSPTLRKYIIVCLLCLPDQAVSQTYIYTVHVYAVVWLFIFACMYLALQNILTSHHACICIDTSTIKYNKILDTFKMPL